ncbi:histidine kinase [Flavobacterium sp.]|uniref:histidine kinase n=1 Tax=Flavobacterium sp. TaxID=239 RepID=UPI0039E567D5
MKKRFVFLFAMWSACGYAQDAGAQKRIAVFNSCPTVECQLSEAIRIAEYYVETDHMDKAQEWLNYSKKLNQFQPKDSISFFINSLQSEAFYYMELYQFGLHEAEKGIERAKILKDSAYLSDAYFFKGINEIEMNQIGAAQQSLWKAQKYYPLRVKKHLRTLIAKAYIYNNIGQVKLRVKQLDSAIDYNTKAYGLARQHQNLRGIVNGEQTFGLIYAEKKNQDSARFYLSKSITSAEQYALQDVATLNCAYLMQTHLENPEKVNELYQKGLGIIAHHEVNNSYERYFYSIALEVFRKLGDQKQIMALQQKVIDVNKDTSNRANYYIQNITEQYMQNENKLLVSRINELDQQRNIAILQLVAAVCGFLVLLFVALFFRRKNKLQQSLLDQKNEISKDLHDDIGSELSSILINANLLLHHSDTNENQKTLIAKISDTSTEISQRLNAFIWSLSTENNSIRSFSEYIKHYASQLLERHANHIRIHRQCCLGRRQTAQRLFPQEPVFCDQGSAQQLGQARFGQANRSVDCRQ